MAANYIPTVPNDGQTQAAGPEQEYMNMEDLQLDIDIPEESDSGTIMAANYIPTVPNNGQTQAAGPEQEYMNMEDLQLDTDIPEESDSGTMAKTYEEEIKTALQNKDLPLAAKKALEYLDKLNNVPVKIAITGEAGSGKSTLVNALRGIKNKTKGAAPTGVKETTIKPTEYIHPKNPNLRIWDLPGIGTVKFTAAKYLKHVGFEKYDFFIIVSSDRFRENDAKLAKEIEKMKKKFYLVRSKIDHNIRDERECNPRITEGDVLKTVRDNCTEELQNLGFESPKIFLVSGLRLHLYEFENLWKTLDVELPKLQRDALLLALPNISAEVIKEKKKTLGRKIKWYTAASTAAGAVPIPGLSVSVDLAMIVAFTVHCSVSLGLTPDLLNRLSEVTGAPVKELKGQIKSRLAGVKITPGLVLKVLASSAAFITVIAIEGGARFIPFVGIPITMCFSGVTTYCALTSILNSLTADSQRVFVKAVQLNASV